LERHGTSKRSTVVSSRGRGSKMLARWAMPCNGPKTDTASSTTASACAMSVSSATETCVLPPAASTSPATAFRRSWSRPTSTTDAPSEPSKRAVEAPMPELAPVTMTGFPARPHSRLDASTLPSAAVGYWSADVKGLPPALSRSTERKCSVALSAENDPDSRDGLVAVVVQAVWDGRLEEDGVARAEHVVLESDRDVQRSREHDSEFAAVVADERVGRAGLAARRVQGVEELDLAVIPCGEPLPADAGLELDDLAVVRPLHEAARAVGGSGDDRLACRRTCAGLGSAARLRRKDIVERDAELADHRIERPHRRLDLSGLDLRHEARGDVESARELAQAQAAFGALAP